MNFIITHKGVLHQAVGNVLPFTTHQPVYEVIRVIDGIALFLEDHFERLRISVQIHGLHFEMEFPEFRQNILELTKLNGKQNGNVKFILTEVEKKINWSFSFIPHNYPTSNDYRNGVATGLLYAERENPNAKVIQNAVSKKANQLIADKILFEVLLVNQNGLITEGSRSNVFFVKGERFYTAQASKVLVGVTRKKVLECLDKLGFTTFEEAVSTSELGAFDAVFLTGTSPKVLPVHCIDNIHFAAKNTFVEQLMIRYDLMIESYLKAHRP